MEQPIYATLAGVELVTIPVTEYADLLDCRRRLAELTLVQEGLKGRSRSPIEDDPEVAVFLAERIGRIGIPAIRAECIGAFGAERTPSRSAIYRYQGRARIRWKAAKSIPQRPG